MSWKKYYEAQVCGTDEDGKEAVVAGHHGCTLRAAREEAARALTYGRPDFRPHEVCVFLCVPVEVKAL